jgi:LacI family transcriptional regulator
MIPRRPSDDFVPKYVRIRDEIARRVESGELAHGDRIPSLREMCAEFNVSTITARRALLDLVNDGVVELRGGRGAFVAGRSRRYRIATLFIGYSESAWRRNSDSFGQLVGGIASAAWEQDAILSVVPVHDPHATMAAVERLDCEQQIDGLLLRINGTVDLAEVDLSKLRGISAVLIKRIVEHPQVRSVIPDSHGAGVAAVNHLVEMGHRRIALLCSMAPVETWRDFHDGYVVAMKKHGLRISADYEIDVPNVFSEIGPQEAGALLSRRDRPTAFVCDSDFLALHVYRAAAARGIAIPDDLSVIGFDDMEFASHLTPPLTTVRLPYYEMGHMAANTLFRVLRGEAVPSVEATPVSLVLRGSTAPPAAPLEETTAIRVASKLLG